MADLDVRDNKNIIIGWRRDSGNQITAIHKRKGFVGYYLKASNITFDAKTGKVYAYGDATDALIREADK